MPTYNSNLWQFLHVTIDDTGSIRISAITKSLEI